MHCGKLDWKKTLISGLAWTALAASAAWIVPVTAQEKGAKKEGAEGKKTIVMKSQKVTPVAGVNFSEALGLDLPDLSTLGSRIDQARSALDPVALALAAKELAAAEEVSGKTASLKSTDLFKEAVALAKGRNRPAELKVVAALIGGDTKKELLAQAEKAEAQIKSRKGGERARGIEGTLYVQNNTQWYIDLYVDGVKVGTSLPYHDGSVYVGESPILATTLYAVAPGTSLAWGPRLIDYRIADVTWTLE